MKTGKISKQPQDYKSLFIKQSDKIARTGSTVYISRENHERITKITQVIGENNVSIFSYIDNVLERHFEKYHNDIAMLYRQMNRDSIF